NLIVEPSLVATTCCHFPRATVPAGVVMLDGVPPLSKRNSCVPPVKPKYTLPPPFLLLKKGFSPVLVFLSTQAEIVIFVPTVTLLALVVLPVEPSKDRAFPLAPLVHVTPPARVILLGTPVTLSAIVEVPSSRGQYAVRPFFETGVCVDWPYA